MISTKQWLSLTTASFMLLAGCAGAPQRSPGPAPGTAGNTVTGSTTGDMDACAAALGNMDPTGVGGVPLGIGMTGTPAGTKGIPVPASPGGTAAGTAGGFTANGIMVGNVALVALPSADPAGGSGATVNQIRTACNRVAEVRVVTNADDRARLAQVTQTIRQGTPITSHMTELGKISSRAHPAWTAGGTSTGAPGPAPGPAPGIVNPPSR